MPPKRPTPAGGAAAGPGQAKQETSSGEQARAGAANDTPTSSAPATPSRPGSATRPPSSASGRGGKPTVTAKPKFAARRSQAARQEAEQAEAKKKAAEAEAAAAEAKKKAQEARKYGYFSGRGDRGGRGRGRGRGGHMGDSLRQRDEPIASGPFSSGKAYSEATARRLAHGGAGGGGGGGAFGGGGGPGTGASRYGGGGMGGSGGASGGVSWNSSGSSYVKTEYGMSDGFMGIKSEEGGYISSEDEDAERKGPKQNIDQLQVIDLTGEHDPGETHVLAPVRLLRVPHKERTLGLVAGGSDDSNDDEHDTISDKRKGKQRTKDVEVTGATERQKRPAVYSSSDTDAEPTIKEEPVDDDTQMRLSTTDPPGAPHLDGGATEQPQDLPSSPETKRKAKAKIKETADAALDEDDFPIPPKPRFETDADEVEWHRKYLDMKLLRDELGSLLPKSTHPGTDSAGDTAMTDATPTTGRVSAVQGQREEATFLFQFPPVLPGLQPITVKPDPESTTAATAAAAATSNDDNMDLDKDDDKDKEAADGIEIKSEHKGESAPTVNQLNLPSGAVGKLRIHRSGKATLDWGGTSLCLGMGADATFLQNVMIAKMPDKKPVDDTQAASAEQEPVFAMGMGQVRGKFVVTPDWEEILK